MAKGVNKKPLGRPTKYSAKMVEAANELGDEGESMAEIAAALGISKDTLYNWIDQHTAFSDAIKGANLRSQVWWERVGKVQATEGTGNASSFIFQMKNRFHKDYRDKVEQEITGKDGEPLVLWPTK